MEEKAYIESGILELYVLGQLNAQEEQEVEVMAAKYPAIKQEILAIELAMEQYAQEQAVAASDRLKSTILNQLTNNTAETEAASPPEATVVSLQQNVYESKIKTLRIALVACIALLLVSVVALFSTRSQLGEAKNEIIALNLDKQKFAAQAGYLKEANSDLQKIADMYNDPDWKAIKLAGTKMDPKAKMVVYWHVTGQHVMVDHSKMQLPSNDEAHQYQLWALVDGKPIDLGVFDVKADSAAHVLLKMKAIDGAQAFAVTLEKRGGSAAPTMEKMIVISKTI